MSLKYRKENNNIFLSINNDLQKPLVDQTSNLFINLYQKISSPLTNNSKYLLGTDLLREK